MTEDVRRDLYAVQVYETNRTWCIVKICTCQKTARQVKKDIEADKHRSFPLISPKIVHPRHEVVEAYLTYDNEIWE